MVDQVYNSPIYNHNYIHTTYPLLRLHLYQYNVNSDIHTDPLPGSHHPFVVSVDTSVYIYGIFL